MRDKTEIQPSTYFIKNLEYISSHTPLARANISIAKGYGFEIASVLGMGVCDQLFENWDPHLSQIQKAVETVKVIRGFETGETEVQGQP